ncbi:MAG: rod shape-determining protein MreC [Roseivirga sp.]|jgi:rod shape-determining protein MreC
MGQLFAFLFKYRAFFIFLILELFCFWLIVGNNNYQRAAYFKASVGVVGSVNEKSDNMSDYFGLKEVNAELAKENARLRALSFNQPTTAKVLDSLSTFRLPFDSTNTVEYVLRSAEIVDNSVRQSRNFFMINKGSKDGISPGMGVINQRGVVGKIRSVSKNFSTGISLLNVQNPISVKHNISGRFGSVLWNGDGRDALHIDLLYITREVNVQIGDSIVTTGYSQIYPKDYLVGTVASVAPDPDQRNLKISVLLSVEFGKLAYVYVIENINRQEVDSLALSTELGNNE